MRKPFFYAYYFCFPAHFLEPIRSEKYYSRIRCDRAFACLTGGLSNPLRRRETGGGTLGRKPCVFLLRGGYTESICQ